MRLITGPPSFHSRSSAGYALIVVMIAATVLLISLAAALPSVYQEGQRQREEELIFRGTEYARAIYLFHRQFNRYPSSVKELLHTNNLSFLRRAYRDPMSASGRWRFIHAAANGAIIDSWTLNLGNQSQLQSQPGSAQPPGATQPFGQSPAVNPSQPAVPNQPTGQTDEAATPGKQQHKTPPECLAKQSGPSSSFFGDSNAVQGAFIAGVASCSDRASIRIWNKHDHYDEWEFLGVSYLPAGLTAGTAGVGAQGQGQSQFGPAQPGSTGLPRTQPSTPELPPLTDQPVGPSGDDQQPQ